MTDLSNLRTASLYINNQLLSRGLLRDGRAIDFADPAGASKGDGKDNSDNDNTANTMARVISIVNDLILRRDVRKRHFFCTTFIFVRAHANTLTQTDSATPNTANLSRQPCAPSAPSPSAKPTTCTAQSNATPTSSAAPT